MLHILMLFQTLVISYAVGIEPVDIRLIYHRIFGNNNAVVVNQINVIE